MAYKQELWDEAKRKCRLGEEEIRMAKEMGLNPQSLIRNIPNKKEMWKAPVKDWIHLSHWFRCYFFALFQEEGEEN